ncbi:hypothetical protein AVEN_99967-1 [Araneus ventricosus]|uniref:Reverse transcriptase domain-containing protein n=1 Tax=Araneus ventricosus TaxID=182803 RepID=A0A4Y2QHA0_ARAVE|nr:hypothetical protein AVEN_99967-1 [Araneus ventricosus]
MSYATEANPLELILHHVKQTESIRLFISLFFDLFKRRKRPAAGILVSSYFPRTDNREGAGETYNSEVTYHLESTNSLSDRQHGFREGKSVDTAINELLSKIQTARRDGKHVLVLSIDIKGAFHNLQHRTILKSLNASA